MTGSLNVWVTPRQHALVGKCLAAARKRAKLTQVDLAKRLGKAQSFVSSYEAGQRRIDIMEFFLIIEALHADPRVVFGEIITQRSHRRR
jgi:transcriptional regulator with XRE-family HTH domain